MARILRPSVLFEARKLNWDMVKDKTNDLVAPLGTPDAFVVRVGDPVWSLRSQEPEGHRDTDPYAAFIPVFGAVNGLLKTDDIVFQGVKLFDQNSDPRTSHNQDDVGTLQVGGTITIHHTGPYNIEVGQMVYGSIFPYTYIDEKGQIQPKIRIPGTQGGKGESDLNSGVSEGRFLPAIFGLKYDDQASYFKKLEMNIRGIMDGKHPEAVTETKEASSFLEEVQYSIEQELFSNAAIDLPARQYANAYAAYHLWSMHSDDQPTQARDVGEAVLSWIQKIYSKCAADSSEYSSNLGANSISFTHPCLNPSIVSELLDKETWEADVRSIEKRRPGAALGVWAKELQDDYRERNSAYLSTHHMGKSEHSVEPAGSFDLFMGIGNRC